MYIRNFYVKILIILTVFIFLSFPICSLENPVKPALDSIAKKQYSVFLQTVVGNFTWEDTGLGTGYSNVLRKMVEEAVLDSEYYGLIRHTGPVFNNPEAALLLDPESWSGAGYLTYGTYSLDGNKIVLKMNVFSFIFNELAGQTKVVLPLSTIPSGVEVLPKNHEVLSTVENAIGDLYGESNLDIYVTTSRGDGGVYTDNEELVLYVLASEDCYIKIFHIDVTGKNTTQVFPNKYEVNNFLPGGRFLKFPGDQAPFKFRLTAPYGAEYIKVVAGTRQFSNKGVAFQNLGMATRGLMLEEVKRDDQEIMAEAEVSYTIVE